MNDVLFARWQMGMSLAFHIVFAAAGIAMPVLMVIAEILAHRKDDADYLALARRWAKGTAVLFAVGAVSGTVLSFELGLLFPRFMELSGAIIGFPFSLEAFAFFTEAIFLGLYLYGWERLSHAVHVAAGIVVALSGLASAVFVTFVNAWMNAPTGFRLEQGKLVDIDPVAGMMTPFALHEIPHTVLSCYAAIGFAVAGIHAYGLLKRPESRLHQRALVLALWMAIPSALLQPAVGHFAGQQVAKHQPLKLAAMEGLERTQARAPLHLGPIAIPGALSFLAHDDFDAVVTGLDQFPVQDRPNASVRIAFQVMVLSGMALAAHAAFSLWGLLRRWALHRNRGYLKVTMALAPFGLIAMEAGWMVTEMGRQPWTVYNVLRTADAATPMPGLIVPLITFSLVYLGLAAVVLIVLWRQLRETS